MAPTNQTVVRDSSGTFVLLFFSLFPVGRVRRKKRNKDRKKRITASNDFELLDESTTKRARERMNREGEH